MCCDMLSLDVSNSYVFDDGGYYDGVGVGYEDGGLGWEGVIFVCNRCVGDVPIYQKVWYVELWSSL